jgi:translation initiation factor IF-3
MIMVLAPTKKKSEAMAEQRRARSASPAGDADAAEAADAAEVTEVPDTGAEQATPESQTPAVAETPAD